MKNYITQSEVDGAVKDELLQKCNKFIASIGAKFKIHCMTKGVHSKDSAHYKGEALDGSVVKLAPDRMPDDIQCSELHHALDELILKPNKSLFEQACIALLCRFSGIGMYPHWSLRGLHLDISNDKTKRPLQWIGLNKKKVQKLIDNEESDQIYIYL
jgi:hypothetical protein